MSAKPSMMDIAAQNPLKISPALFPPSKVGSFYSGSRADGVFARGYAVDAHDMHAATTYENLQTIS